MANDDIKKYRQILSSILNESEGFEDIEEEFILPSHWASALVDGDFTGVTDEEEEEIREFLDANPMAHWITGDVEELGFRSYNDANRLGGDVSLFKAFRRVSADEAQELKESQEIIPMPMISKPYDLKKHVAQHFDHFEKNIQRLYPEDQKRTLDIFLKFLKGQEIDRDELKDLNKTLSKKVLKSGSPYDVMAGFTDKLMSVI